MKEKIEDIATCIKKYRDLELSILATNNAVGRSMTLYNKVEQQFWLINKQVTVVQFQRDILGNIIPETGFSEAITYNCDGIPVPRYSKLGGLLNQFLEGNHKIPNTKGRN